MDKSPGSKEKAFVEKLLERPAEGSLMLDHLMEHEQTFSRLLKKTLYALMLINPVHPTIFIAILADMLGSLQALHEREYPGTGMLIARNIANGLSDERELMKKEAQGK